MPYSSPQSHESATRKCKVHGAQVPRVAERPLHQRPMAAKQRGPSAHTLHTDDTISGQGTRAQLQTAIHWQSTLFQITGVRLAPLKPVSFVTCQRSRRQRYRVDHVPPCHTPSQARARAARGFAWPLRDSKPKKERSLFAAEPSNQYLLMDFTDLSRPSKRAHLAHTPPGAMAIRHAPSANKVGYRGAPSVTALSLQRPCPLNDLFSLLHIHNSCCPPRRASDPPPFFPSSKQQQQRIPSYNNHRESSVTVQRVAPALPACPYK